MMDWKQSLADVDEDYLVGISNKGIVKRAYKDLGETGDSDGAALAETDWTAQELVVTAGGETVRIRFPLGESQCSCPSRSICRHVIMGILLAKQAAALGEETDAVRPGSEEFGAGSGDIPEKTGEETDAAAPDGKEMGNDSFDNIGKRGSEPGAPGNTEQNRSEREKEMPSEGSLGEQVWQEVLAHPRKPLLRALGSKGLRRLVSIMEAGEAPRVERSSVVKVQLPGQEIAVKLLSPLPYSTCTCHKKELCSHKAEAILWCQYLEKQLTAEELTTELEQEPDLEPQELQETAEQIRSCLEGLLEVGLARGGQERVEELERLAILCHNAGLPGWEGDLRALADSYGKYLRRSAGLTMEKLAGQLQRLYHRTRQLEVLVRTALNSAAQEAQREKASEETQREKPSEEAQGVISRIQALAGEFRSTYLPVGELEPTGITVEHFVSDSGYEGDTVYFLEISTGTWYTYTNARPTFYEGKKRGGYQEKTPAPWGISLPLEGLVGVQLRLRGAKCDAAGRLSSSQETQGEILGRSELTAEKLEGWYYREYDRLFAEQIPPPEPQQQAAAGDGHPRLVFVQAERFQQGKFNEITQKLELPIWDPAGRQVLVELPYSKREETSIRYLERLKKKQKPCFLGRVYLRESRICLYPVDLLERRELEDTGTDIGEWLKQKKEDLLGKSEEVVCQENGDEENTFRVLQSYLEEVSWLLQEVYQVGSATTQDSTLEALQHASEQGKSYGMTALSDWLRQLREQLALSRHRMKHGSAETMEIYCRLWQYVELCRRRTAYDLARAVYCGAGENTYNAV